MKNKVKIIIICIIYFLFSVATSVKDDMDVNYNKCLYKIADTLSSIDMGKTFYRGSRANDTILFSIQDTTKVNLAANFLCSQLKDSCSLKNRTLLFFNSSVNTYDSIWFINGKLFFSKTCN